MYLFQLKKQIKILLIFSIIFICNAGILEGAQPKEYDAVIYTSNRIRYKGFLEDVTEKGITIDYLGQSKYIAADSIQGVKIKRSDALKNHALAGAAFGLIAGIPVYLDGHGQGKLSLLALPVVLIGMTLSGALVGSFVNTVTHVKRYKIQGDTGFKSIYPILFRYSRAGSSRKANE